MDTGDMKLKQRTDEAGVYVQQVVCALLAVGLQGVAPDGLCHLLCPEHAANTQHHLVQHQKSETKHCSNIAPKQDAVSW